MLSTGFFMTIWNPHSDTPEHELSVQSLHSHFWYIHLQKSVSISFSNMGIYKDIQVHARNLLYPALRLPPRPVTTVSLVNHASRKHSSFIKLVCTKRILTTHVTVADNYPEFFSLWRAHGNFLSHTSNTHRYKSVRHDRELPNMLTWSSLTRRFGAVTMCLTPQEMYEVIKVT
jgi:hypothetical protein